MLGFYKTVDSWITLYYLPFGECTKRKRRILILCILAVIKSMQTTVVLTMNLTTWNILLSKPCQGNNPKFPKMRFTTALAAVGVFRSALLITSKLLIEAKRTKYLRRSGSKMLTRWSWVQSLLTFMVIGSSSSWKSMYSLQTNCPVKWIQRKWWKKLKITLKRNSLWNWEKSLKNKAKPFLWPNLQRKKKIRSRMKCQRDRLSSLIKMILTITIRSLITERV